MLHLVLPDGRWLDMDPTSVNDQIEIYDLDEDPESNRIDMKRWIRDKLTARTKVKSWEGDIGDLSSPEMLLLWRRWVTASEEDAVPFESGSDSVPQPSQPRSPARTARGARSKRRRSSSS